MEHSKDLVSVEIFAAGSIFDPAPSDAPQERRAMSQGLLLLCHCVCHQGLGRAEGMGVDMEGKNAC